MFECGEGVSLLSACATMLHTMGGVFGKKSKANQRPCSTMESKSPFREFLIQLPRQPLLGLGPCTEVYSDENLMTLDVLTVGGHSYSFVHRLHPAMMLLRRNAGRIGINVKDYIVVDQNWYCIDTACLRELCTNVVTPVPRLVGLADALV